MTKLISFLFVLFAHSVFAESLLAPVKLETPRETLRTFMQAMNSYKEGVEKDDKHLRAEISKALRSLDLTETPAVLRNEVGKERAIFLKEVIDRIIVIDYQKVPDTTDLKSWRLKDTEIRLLLSEEGETKGQYLFSKDTVRRAREFYEKVQHLSFKKGSGGGAGYLAPWYEEFIPSWAEEKEFLIPNWQWIVLLVALFFGFLMKELSRPILRLVLRITEGRLHWQNRAIAAVQKPSGYILASAFWFAALYFFPFEGKLLGVLTFTVQIVFSISLVWCLYQLTYVFTDFFKEWCAKTNTSIDDHLIPIIGKSARFMVIIFGILLTVQNLGFNVLSLLAGLGLGGLAFALAAKDACANLFGSVMIFLDQPFKVGDWVVAGDSEGTVEEIGFRSTRIRTFYNSVISVPNSHIANVNIDNMGQREFRRTRAVLGITYDTPPEKLEAFMEGIKKIIQANEFTRKDYMQVAFHSFGDSSLNILVYFFVKVPDWSQELLERQNVYLEILRLAKDLEVEFAYPTQTLHVETFPEKKPVREQSLPEIEKLRETSKEFGPDGKRAKPKGLGLFQPPFKEY